MGKTLRRRRHPQLRRETTERTWHPAPQALLPIPPWDEGSHGFVIILNVTKRMNHRIVQLSSPFKIFNSSVLPIDLVFFYFSKCNQCIFNIWGEPGGTGGRGILKTSGYKINYVLKKKRHPHPNATMFLSILMLFVFLKVPLNKKMPPEGRQHLCVCVFFNQKNAARRAVKFFGCCF